MRALISSDGIPTDWRSVLLTTGDSRGKLFPNILDVSIAFICCTYIIFYICVFGFLFFLFSTDNQLSSVQRQLNLYGFKCINRGEDKGAFYHPKFKRGEWEVVKKITRYSPSKKSDSPQFGEKSEGMDTFEVPPTTVAPVFTNTSTESSFFQPSTFGNPSFGFPSYHFDVPPATWYPANMYGGFSGPIDFHHAAHFPPPYSSSMASATPAASNASTLPTDSKAEQAGSGANSVDGSAMSTTDADEQTERPDNVFAEAKVPKKSFVNVINDVVLVDPYFDLDEDLDALGDVGESHTSLLAMQPSIGRSTSATKREIGVNTDLSQINYNFF
jgi:hypothetical protein